MSSSLRTLAALLVTLVFIFFIYGEADAINVQTVEFEGQGPYFIPKPEREEPNPIPKPVAIMPEDPITFDLKESDDGNKKNGPKGQTESSTTTRKREYHRRMMRR